MKSKEIDNEINDVEVVTEERELETHQSIKPEKKKMNKLYLTLLILFCLGVITSICLIGYFRFNWFQKEPNNIVKIEKEQYQVDNFSHK